MLEGPPPQISPQICGNIFQTLSSLAIACDAIAKRERSVTTPRQIMKKTILVGILILRAVLLALRAGTVAASRAVGEVPQFTAEAKLVRPTDYRRWIYVSSGFG